MNRVQARRNPREVALSPDTTPAAAVHTYSSALRDLEPEARLEKVASAAGLDQSARDARRGAGSLPLRLANGMIENVIGRFDLPLGIAANFRINGREYLIPMAFKEPSIIVGASNMARIARTCGGFETSSSAPIMRAQVQVLSVSDPFAARARILAGKAEILAVANAKDKVLIGLGGGCRDIEVHIFEDTSVGPMVIVHLVVDVRDAMGANAMAETIAPMIEKITGGTVRLRILSNLADLRLARATVRLTPESLKTCDFSGERVASGIVKACALAIVDPYRAATYNKGIMNGIDPLVVATGNDWRAVEAGAHAWACRSGRYTSLANWELDGQGHLVGTLEIPMPLSLVGGATKIHPAAQAALALLDVRSANELGEIAVAVGLAQNMAALRASATEIHGGL
jgi:hydroxymethylglutaryl-CoA reductase